MTAGALSNGYDTDTMLNCSSAFRVGNRDFKNYESGAYGSIGFAKALEVSCNTFFYRVGLRLLAALRLRRRPTWTPRTRWSRRPRTGASASETGIDLPGEASGRIADRQWKRDYYESMKDYYCGISTKPQDADDQRLRLQVRPRVLRRGLRLPGR